MARVAPGQRLAMVHRNCRRLLRLVNALLEFSQIESGRSHASYEPTDLAAYTADLASLFRVVWADGTKGIALPADLTER